MSRKVILSVSLTLLLFLPQTGRAVAPVAVSQQFENLEGVAFCPDGSGYVTENKKGLLHRLKPDLTAEKSWPLPGALGLLCTSKGVLYANAFKDGKVFRLEKDELILAAQGMKGANALAELPDGRVLVSDSEGGGINEVLPGKLVLFLGGLTYPNGLAFVPGLGLAFNATTGQAVMLVRDLQKPVAEKWQKGLMVPDGLMTGPDGALYAAEFGRGNVLRFTVAGEKSVVATGLKSPASLAFGTGVFGPGKLYVTSLMGKGIYVLDVPVKP